MHKFSDSSNIEGASYDAAARRLTVEFKGGGQYHYADVKPELWSGLMDAHGKGGSVGKFFHANIRNAHKATKAEKQGEGQ